MMNPEELGGGKETGNRVNLIAAAGKKISEFFRKKSEEQLEADKAENAWDLAIGTAKQLDEESEKRNKETAQALISVPGVDAEFVARMLGEYNDGDSLTAFVEKAKIYREEQRREAEKVAQAVPEVEPEAEVAPRATDLDMMDTGVSGMTVEDAPFMDAINRSFEEAEYGAIQRDTAEMLRQYQQMGGEALGASREKLLSDMKVKLAKRSAAVLTVAGIILGGSILVSSLFGKEVKAEGTEPEVPLEPRVEQSTDQEIPELDDEIAVEAETLMDSETLRSGDLVSDVYEKMDMQALGKEVFEKYFDTEGSSIAADGAHENLTSFRGEKSSQFAFGEGMNTDGMTKEEIADLFMVRNVNDPLVLISTVSGFDTVMRGAGISEDIIQIEGMADQARALEGVMNEETQLKMIGALYAALVNDSTEIKNETVTRTAKTYGITENSETGERNLKVYNVVRNMVKQFFIQLRVGGKTEKVYFNTYCGGQRDELREVPQDDEIDFEVTEQEDNTVTITMNDEQTEQKKGDNGKGGGTTNKGETGEQSEEIKGKNAEHLQENAENTLSNDGAEQVQEDYSVLGNLKSFKEFVINPGGQIHGLNSDAQGNLFINVGNNVLVPIPENALVMDTGGGNVSVLDAGGNVLGVINVVAANSGKNSGGENREEGPSSSATVGSSGGGGGGSENVYTPVETGDTASPGEVTEKADEKVNEKNDVGASAEEAADEFGFN